MKTIFLIIIVLLLLNLCYTYSCSQKYECFQSSITDNQLKILTNLEPHLMAIKTLADLSTDLMNGSINVPGGLTITGPLTVVGKTDLKNDVVVRGNGNFEKILTVQGDTRLQKSVAVNGNARLQTLVVSGATDLQKTLIVQGDTNLKSKLIVEGNTNLKSNVIIGITQPVVTTSPAPPTTAPMFKFNNPFTPPVVNNILTVNGDTLLNEGLRVEQGTDIRKNLVVRGPTSLEKTLIVVKDVVVNTSIRTPKISIPHPTDINATGGVGVELTNEKEGDFNRLVVNSSITTPQILIPNSTTKLGTEKPAKIYNDNGDIVFYDLNSNKNPHLTFRFKDHNPQGMEAYYGNKRREKWITYNTDTEK